MTIARQFWRNSDGSTVIMLGGELRVDTEDTLGEITLNQLAGFNADHAILAAAGVSETGDIMRYRIDEVMIARAMVARAREVTIVADHTKFESIAPMNICGLQQVTNLVTDRPVSDSFAELAARSGTNLVIASTNSGG
jgi:DeoR family glycerol-3-phosphate regulon repressor